MANIVDFQAVDNLKFDSFLFILNKKHVFLSYIARSSKLVDIQQLMKRKLFLCVFFCSFSDVFC